MPLITLRVHPDVLDIHIQTDKMIVHPGLSPQDSALWALGLYIDDVYPLCFDALHQGGLSQPIHHINSHTAYANAVVAVPPTAITMHPTGPGPADLLVRFPDDPTASPFAYDVYSPSGWHKVEHPYFLAPKGPLKGAIHPESPLALFDPTTLTYHFPQGTDPAQDNAYPHHPSSQQRAWGFVAGVCNGLLGAHTQAELPHAEALDIGLYLAFEAHATACQTPPPTTMPKLLPTFTGFVHTTGLLLRASPALRTYTTHASFSPWRDSLPRHWVDAGRAAAPFVHSLQPELFAQCRALLGHPDDPFFSLPDTPPPTAHTTLQTTAKLAAIRRAVEPHLAHR